VCVCVCVCVRARARERRLDLSGLLRRDTHVRAWATCDALSSFLVLYSQFSATPLPDHTITDYQSTQFITPTNCAVLNNTSGISFSLKMAELYRNTLEVHL
jgi:hypothetical protein